jgi:hypothetical protein
LNIKQRKLLLLQNPSTLNSEETWLRKAYSNIVSNLLGYAIDPSSSIDPFAAKFMGIEAVEDNNEEYEPSWRLPHTFGVQKEEEEL